MTIYLALGILILSVVSLTQGAFWLSDKTSFLSSFVSKKFTYGLPVLFVASFLVYAGNSQLAIGTIIGSVILSVLILGVTAIIKPLEINKSLALKEIFLSIISPIVLALLIFKDFLNFIFTWNILKKEEQDGFLTEWQSGKLDKLQFGDLYISQGIILCLIFAIIALGFFNYKRPQFSKLAWKQLPWKSIGTQMLGLLFIVVGSKLASLVALNAGSLLNSALPNWLISPILTDRIIGLLFISLICVIPLIANIAQKIRTNQVENSENPEKTTNIFNDVIRINVFNILIGFGVIGLISRITILGSDFKTQLFDLGDLALASLILFVVTLFTKKNQFNKTQGIILVLAYLLYIAYLLYTFYTKQV